MGISYKFGFHCTPSYPPLKHGIFHEIGPIQRAWGTPLFQETMGAVSPVASPSLKPWNSANPQMGITRPGNLLHSYRSHGPNRNRWFTELQQLCDFTIGMSYYCDFTII